MSCVSAAQPQENFNICQMGGFEKLKSILKDFSALPLAPRWALSGSEQQEKTCSLSICIFLGLKKGPGGLGQRQVAVGLLAYWA